MPRSSLKELPLGTSSEFQKLAARPLIALSEGGVVMSMIFKMHRLPRLLAAVCVALTISVPFAAAYVSAGKSTAPTEQTSGQIDRSNKGDRLQVSPQQKPVERDGAKQIEPPTPVAGPRMLA